MPASGTNAVNHLQNHAESIATWWSLEIMESKQHMISKLYANKRSASCRAKALTVYHTKSVASVCVTCTNLSKQNGLVSNIRYAHILSTLVLDISGVLSCHITCHTCHMLLCHVVSIGPLSCGSCGSMHWVTNNKQCFAARQTRHLASHIVLAAASVQWHMWQLQRALWEQKKMIWDHHHPTVVDVHHVKSGGCPMALSPYGRNPQNPLNSN